LVFSEDPALGEWIKAVNVYGNKTAIKMSDLLSFAAEKFLELNGDGDETSEDDEMDIGLDTQVEKIKTKKR